MKTTQIYAKIVDSKKVEAVNLVDGVFDFSLIPTDNQTKHSDYHIKFIIFATKYLECQYLIGLKTEK